MTRPHASALEQQQHHQWLRSAISACVDGIALDASANGDVDIENDDDHDTGGVNHSVSVSRRIQCAAQLLDRCHSNRWFGAYSTAKQPATGATTATSTGTINGTATGTATGAGSSNSSAALKSKPASKSDGWDDFGFDDDELNGGGNDDDDNGAVATANKTQSISKKSASAAKAASEADDMENEDEDDDDDEVKVCHTVMLG